MSLVYVFAASPMEAEPIRKIAGEGDVRTPVHCGSNDVVLIVSGMGPSNAKSKADLALVLGQNDLSKASLTPSSSSDCVEV